MALRPTPSGATIVSGAGVTGLTASFTSDGSPLYVAVFGSVNVLGAADFTATCTFNSVALEKWGNWFSAARNDLMRVFIFSLATPTVGSHTLDFQTAGIGAWDWTMAPFNVANGPLNGGILLPGGFYLFDADTTLTKTAYAWDPDGTQITFAWSPLTGTPVITTGTNFVAGGGLSGNYQNANDGELPYTTTLTPSGKLGMFSFTIPSQQSMTGGVCYPWATGLTTVAGFTPGAQILVGLPNGNDTGGGTTDIGLEGNIILHAGTVRSLAIRAVGLTGAMALTAEIMRGGAGASTGDEGSSFMTPTGVTLVATAADPNTELDLVAHGFSKYERLSLKYTNTGVGTPGLGATVCAALLCEPGGGASQNNQCYGGGAKAFGLGSPTVDSPFERAPLHPWGTTPWGQVQPLSQQSLVGIAHTVTELVVDYQRAVTLDPDHTYNMRVGGVIQDGSGGTVDTTATLVPNTMNVALARSRFTLPVAAATLIAPNYIAFVGYVRDVGSAYLRQAASMLVTPATRGQFMLSGTAQHTGSFGFSTSANSSAFGFDNVANVGLLQQPIPPMTFTGDDLHALGVITDLLGTPPSGATAWNQQLLKNAVASSMPALVISGAATTGTTGGDVTYAGGDTWNFLWTPTSFPTSLFQFWSIPGYITPPPLEGTIIVVKDAGDDVTTLFDFTALGGLLPGTFQLVGGGSQTFPNVPVGSGYGVTETPPTGWEPPSIHVSNGNPPTNITIIDGDIVTVTFTNSLRYGAAACPLPSPAVATGQNACPAPDPAAQ